MENSFKTKLAMHHMPGRFLVLLGILFFPVACVSLKSQKNIINKVLDNEKLLSASGANPDTSVIRTALESMLSKSPRLNSKKKISAVSNYAIELSTLQQLRKLEVVPCEPYALNFPHFTPKQVDSAAFSDDDSGVVKKAAINANRQIEAMRKWMQAQLDMQKTRVHIDSMVIFLNWQQQCLSDKNRQELEIRKLRIEQKRRVITAGNQLKILFPRGYKQVRRESTH